MGSRQARPNVQTRGSGAPLGNWKLDLELGTNECSKKTAQGQHSQPGREENGETDSAKDSTVCYVPRRKGKGRGP